ncbi:SH2 domain containing 3Cb isoform X1 [Solea solea]|uniref:SH2 domain containing 3Cb isoform X1 n=2 Tax=Solea solea TaxID=90069 RepID=UPI00272D8E6B|nr:SH2 domain containing 3Cb isoform X1 [Solea solea]
MDKRRLNLKWFGSLTNLSIRRSPSKTSTKTAQEHDGSRDGRSQGGAPSAPVDDQSVDDMAPRLHSSNYACSSDMYTHVGTVPRSEKRSCRRLKEKKKSRKEEGEGVKDGQSQWKAMERVQDSPLLGALSSLSLTTVDHNLSMSAPVTPTPRRASPLTSAPESRFGHSSRDHAPSISRHALEIGRCVKNPANMAAHSPNMVPQDVYVSMDPITNETHNHLDDKYGKDERRRLLTSKQETKNPPRDAEDVDREHELTGRGGEYVKFSKGKLWLEPPSEEQRKQLEEELRLSGTNLRSHAWYHGHIPWEVSESLLVNQGDFLIRDSQSSQGDFVLTCHWEQNMRHFLIRTTAVQSSETFTRIQYSLEGEAFDTLPALVHFYVGRKTPVSRCSGVQVHQPVNRMLPLGDLETAFGTAASPQSCQRGLSNDCTGGGEKVEQRLRPWSPSSLHHRETDKNQVQDEQTQLAPEESVPSSLNSINTSQSRSLCRSQTGSAVGSAVGSKAPFPSLARCPHIVQPTSSSNSTLPLFLPHLNQTPASNPEGSCYTELYLGPQTYVERLRDEKDSGNVHFSPVVEAVSSFGPSRYKSQLIPKENKPLEVGILRRVKDLLAEIDPRAAAKHITKADCMVARILEVTPEVQRMMGVSSGMELLTLPHGHQLRQDLLERFHTMAIMLAVDVLGCTGTNEERAGLLHKIIQIAAELKNTMGNMFGFAAVMRALQLPQVSRLEQTWVALRQRHTEGAVLYEKTLRPFMKSLNDGRESCPLSNVTFPHVLPLLSLLEKTVAVGDGTEHWEVAEASMDAVMFHLGAARTIAQLGGIYRSNAENKLQGFQEQAEVQEIFLTDFQLRLLWGSRGATENQALRYAKFDQVLTALSNKLEAPVRTH